MAKRRDQGQGSVFWDTRRKRYVGLLDLGTDATGKRHRQKFSGTTKAVVNDKIRRAQREVAEGRPLGQAADTVRALLNDYYARGLPPTAKSPKTIENYRWIIEDHLVPTLGARKLKDLSPDDVDAALAAKVNEGFAQGSLTLMHTTLTKALRWGEQRGRVGRNVSRLADTPRASKPRRQGRALTVEQVRALIAAVATDRLEALFLLGLAVPSRPAELTGLTWPMVDFEHGVIHFRYALHYEGGRLFLGQLKSPESRRSVEVPASVMMALKRRLAAQRREQLVSTTWANPDELVFTAAESGNGIYPENLRRTLRRLTRQASIDGRVTPYAMRHTVVSVLSAAGVPIEQIADLAGHRPRTTAEVYRHNLSETLRSARGPIEAAFDVTAES